MLPAFREGDYSAGMVAGVEAAAAVLEGGEADLSGDGGELPAWMIFVIVVGFIVGPLGLVLAVYYGRRRCPKCFEVFCAATCGPDLPAGGDIQFGDLQSDAGSGPEDDDSIHGDNR